MKRIWSIGLLAALLVSGCRTRSISDSGYHGGGGYYGHGAFYGNGVMYQGELTEFDVLGVDPKKHYSDEEIAAALSGDKAKLTLPRGSSVLLVQSGAMMPDKDMIDCMEKYYAVSVFSGIPESRKDSNDTYASALRYSAAKAGIGRIVAYWGILESGTRNLATKAVSWVPIVGAGVPDQAQEIRIRLKVALIDVRTGQWEMFTPQVFNDGAVSAAVNREQSDQTQVALLKAQGYQAAVDGILARYGR